MVLPQVQVPGICCVSKRVGYEHARKKAAREGVAAALPRPAVLVLGSVIVRGARAAASALRARVPLRARVVPLLDARPQPPVPGAVCSGAPGCWELGAVRIGSAAAARSTPARVLALLCSPLSCGPAADLFASCAAPAFGCLCLALLVTFLCECIYSLGCHMSQRFLSRRLFRNDTCLSCYISGVEQYIR